MKNVKVNLKVAKGTQFSPSSIQYDPKCLIKDDLAWKSASPEVVTIDKSSGFACAIGCGRGTLFAVDKNNTIRVLCDITVEDVVGEDSSRRITANSSIELQTIRYYSDCNSVTAMGYTGKTFSYTTMGTRVTLESGWAAKNGYQDYYSSMFRSELVYMKNIYAAMTPDQRAAWLELRINGFIQQGLIFVPARPAAFIYSEDRKGHRGASLGRGAHRSR